MNYLDNGAQNTVILSFFKTPYYYLHSRNIKMVKKTSISQMELLKMGIIDEITI